MCGHEGGGQKMKSVKLPMMWIDLYNLLLNTTIEIYQNHATVYAALAQHNCPTDIKLSTLRFIHYHAIKRCRIQ
ncbi:hypothetical protein ACTXT7_015683 [Hymenolepis weldensis]